jgi:hypothetical protein
MIVLGNKSDLRKKKAKKGLEEESPFFISVLLKHKRKKMRGKGQKENASMKIRTMMPY